MIVKLYFTTWLTTITYYGKDTFELIQHAVVA